MDYRENDNKDYRVSNSDAKRVYGDGTAGYAQEDFTAPLWFVKSRHGIYYVLGVLEVLLAFRFVFKLLGANPRSGFVSFIYNLTGIFLAPFSGIFNTFVTNGLSASSVFEPANIIAMAVYWLAAWGLVKLIWLKAVRDGHA